MQRPRLALTLIAFLGFISLGLPDTVNGVAWPSVRQDFRLPIGHLAILIASGTIGYLVASFGSGAIVRRLGVGKLLLVSSLLVAGASAGYALAPAWPVMLACGVFSGLGAGAIDAGINAYAARHFSPRVVNWLHACYGIGATLGPAMMTAVLGTGLVWRWGYGINAVLLAGMAVCFLLTLKLWEAPPPPAEATAAPLGEAVVTDAHPASSAPTPGTLATLRRPIVLLSMLIFFLYPGMEVTAGQWTYSLFIESRGVSPSVAGTWVSIYWAGLTLGRIVFGSIASHLKPMTILRWVTLASPVGALLVWFNPWSVGGYAGLAMLGFCFAPIFPMLISLTPARVGKDAADQVIGFQISAACLGIAGVPGLVGVLTKWQGLEVVGPVLLASCLAVLVMNELIARVADSKPAELSFAPVLRGEG